MPPDKRFQLRKPARGRVKNARPAAFSSCNFTNAHYTALGAVRAASERTVAQREHYIRARVTRRDYTCTASRAPRSWGQWRGAPGVTLFDYPCPRGDNSAAATKAAANDGQANLPAEKRFFANAPSRRFICRPNRYEKTVNEVPSSTFVYCFTSFLPFALQQRTQIMSKSCREWTREELRTEDKQSQL